jgi:hypothetical protein
LNRKRQEWVEGECADKTGGSYCPAETETTQDATSSTATSTQQPVTAPEVDVQNEADRMKEKSGNLYLNYIKVCL